MAEKKKTMNKSNDVNVKTSNTNPVADSETKTNKDMPKAEVKKAKTVKKVTPKQLTAKAEPKKLTTKAEPKKIAVKEAPKKITAKPAPKKLTAKAEPKKLTQKQIKAQQAIMSAELLGKQVEIAVEKRKEAMKETKEKVKETAKAVTKKAKEDVKPVAKKAKETVKKVDKKVKETAVETKETAAKSVKDETLKLHEFYDNLNLDECFEHLHKLNINLNYDDMYQLALVKENLEDAAATILKDANLARKKLTLAKDGITKDVVLETLKKVAEYMDIKAMEYEAIRNGIKKCTETKLSDDFVLNSQEYLKEFKLAEKILMIGQRRDMHTLDEVEEVLGIELIEFIQHFFAQAYAVLPGYQYKDVSFYEDFAFAILSQYEDIYQKFELALLLDVADLYIKHNDYRRGDENYGYILRENQIKDYIYYRFASVYKDKDIEKAKAIAQSSLSVVDDRYEYYQPIIDIINS